MKTFPLIIACTLAALGFSSCATKREVPFCVSPVISSTGKKARYDYSHFAKIPDTPTCFTYRAVLKAIPYTRKRAFYGNYAGSGNRGGRPIDAMDNLCRLHDIVYAEAETLRTMQWADAACMEALNKLDRRTLSPEALAFRDRFTGFFINPATEWMGKPVSAFFRTQETDDCPFQTEDDVRRFFGIGEGANRVVAAGPLRKTHRRASVPPAAIPAAQLAAR
jgi:hypothetical protein